jgi:hypothetical protein
MERVFVMQATAHGPRLCFGKSRGVDMKLSEWNMSQAVKEKIVWTCGGAVFALLLAFIVGGVYTITPPSGPVDAAYKMNRFTGKVWLIKTYAKPMAQGQVRVLVAREAEVEKTRDLKEEDLQALAMNQPEAPATTGRRR